MTTGIIFDIKQFALFDGPGIRTTVFLKGCPMRCQWCHNPEGQRVEPELMVSKASCLHCGACERVCRHPDACVLCGACIEVCPLHLRRIAGVPWNSETLTEKLLKDKDFFTENEGGVTFSGGEPTMQSEFLFETAERLSGAGVHLAIETCGFCSEKVFQEVMKHFDLILMDVKVVDPVQHKKFIGVDNAPILANLEQLKASGKPFWIRIPVIPGVNDSEENFRATAGLIAGTPGLKKLELLPYHVTAGAKYDMVNREYKVDFDPTQKPNLDLSVFKEQSIPCSVL